MKFNRKIIITFITLSIFLIEASIPITSQFNLEPIEKENVLIK